MSKHIEPLKLFMLVDNHIITPKQTIDNLEHGTEILFTIEEIEEIAVIAAHTKLGDDELRKTKEMMKEVGFPTVTTPYSFPDTI